MPYLAFGFTLHEVLVVLWFKGGKITPATDGKGPANLGCVLSTTESFPSWGRAAGFGFSPIPSLQRLNVMLRFGLLASSPFPLRPAWGKALMS